LILAFAGAGVAEWGLRRLFARQFAAARAQAGQRPAWAVVVFGIDLAGIAVFVVVAAGLFLLGYRGHDATRQLFMTLLAAGAITRLALALSRLLLAPGNGA